MGVEEREVVLVGLAGLLRGHSAFTCLIGVEEEPRLRDHLLSKLSYFAQTKVLLKLEVERMLLVYV